MQFTAYRNANAASRKRVPYLLAVQSDLIENASTCVVVPMIASQRAGVPVSRLMPTFDIAGTLMVMDTLQLAAVPRAVLGAPIGDLSHERAAIMSALDLLISGI